MSLVLLESSNGFYIVKDKKILKQHLFTNAKEALTDLEVLKSGTLPVSLSTLINDIKEEIVSSDNSLEMFKYDVEKYREAKNMHKSLYTETPTFLSHKMSESVVKVPVDLSTLIIKSFNIYDELDANLNLKIMKVRDWYGFCYPELSKIITDNRKYLECHVIIGNKNDLADVKLERIDGEVKKVKIDTNISSALFDEIVNSDCSKVEKLRKIGIEDGIIEDILESSQQSIGTEMTEEDLSKIVDVVRTILSDFEYKNNLMLYLKEKLNELMPNTKALIDNDLITCKLLAKAGSLTNLAKLPASTIQIYGAEKGYFNAVKAQGNTPKYGFIFHAPIVSRSVMKGKVARMLATKIILAVRVDFFGNKDGKYGEKLRIDLEKRVDRVENFKKKVKTVKKDKKVEFSDKKEYDTYKDK